MVSDPLAPLAGKGLGRGVHFFDAEVTFGNHSIVTSHQLTGVQKTGSAKIDEAG